MLADPVADLELGAILATLTFSGWWFSPAQRSRRRRDAARARVELRRALRGHAERASDAATSISSEHELQPTEGHLPDCADAAAVAEFPELAALITIRDAGWTFLPLRRDDAGRPDELDGFREWPGGWIDAIRVRSGTDAMALRRAPGGQMSIVWELAGTLADVVSGLLALPAPDQSTAPRLIRRAAPRLWAP